MNGEAWREITEVARQTSADLIVIGTTGTSGTSDAQGLGTVAALAGMAVPAGAGAIDGAIVAAFPGITGGTLADAVTADLAVRAVQFTAFLFAVPSAIRVVAAATAD